ncbi:hypothetical protein NMQ14_04535 [Methyloversatilis sp. XJ19-13]|uniref:hypothetical protein n=1 Tax=Methyloversatilis sp. XJ19-13 TaxID=2963430 RepID=UPI00211CB7B8|nr:hypothetical protein [Methyloversatilis sp. XJ19-13]MCQ9373509.1 hypothetical protein [Methyloversatilis sp. XJ19-13]
MRGNFRFLAPGTKRHKTLPSRSTSSIIGVFLSLMASAPSIARAEKVVDQLHLDFPTRTETVCLGTEVDFFGKTCVPSGYDTLTVRHSNSYSISPKTDYRFCAYRVTELSGNPSAAGAWFDDNLSSEGRATVSYQVPCGGGGISIQTFQSLVAVGKLVYSYFSADGNTAASAIDALINAQTVLEYAAASQALYGVYSDIEGVIVAANSNSNNAETCGLGDAGNWLDSYAETISESVGDACAADYGDGWRNFNNAAPAISGGTPQLAAAILPIISGLLLDHDDPTNQPRQAQTIDFAPISDFYFGEGGFSISLNASSGLPVSVESTTPSVCRVVESGFAFDQPGECTFVATQSGNEEFNAAAAITRSFTVLPERLVQQLPFAVGGSLRAGDLISISPLGDSGLPVLFSILTPQVCAVQGNNVIAVQPGECRVSFSIDGNAAYRPVQATYAFSVSSGGIDSPDGDVPLPGWALAALGAALTRVAVRRHSVVSPAG